MQSLLNRPAIGQGIYPINEVANILRLPYYKVNRWIDQYWDGELGHAFEQHYSWKVDGSKAVNFYTLIELYVMLRFTEAGVKTREVIKAHLTLAEWMDHAYPFALRTVLTAIRTDGKKIFFRIGNDTVTLDGTRQLNMDFINFFFKKLDFDSEELVSRYWPLGRERSIVIDPARKFGAPVIADKNISPEVLYNHFKAGDPPAYLAHIYALTESQIQDAIEFCEAA